LALIRNVVIGRLRREVFAPICQDIARVQFRVDQ